MKDSLRDVLTEESKKLNLEMLSLEIMQDNLHLFVGAKSTYVPYQIVKQLKEVSSIQLREQFPELEYLRYPKHVKHFKNLWARGYYCGSAGHVGQYAVQRYNLELDGKDVFEYNIFGDHTGQTEIGDFTR